MNLKQMEYFIAIVDEGSIMAASKTLHMCQPPLSNQMKLLEDELGVVLFERGRKNITLTDAGKHFLERARAIMDMTFDTKREIEAFSSGLQGTLRMGLVSSTQNREEIGRLNEFSRLCTQVNFRISEGNTYEMIEGVKHNLLDFAMVRTPFLAEGLDCKYLEKERMMAVGRKEYMQGKKGSISLEELRGVPLIIYRRWEAVLNQAFKEPYPNYLCINDDARTTLLWAESGAGIGIVPYSIVKHNENRELFVSRIDSPMMDTQLVLIKKKNLTFSQLGEKFWEFYGGRKPL